MDRISQEVVFSERRPGGVWPGSSVRRADGVTRSVAFRVAREVNKFSTLSVNRPAKGRGDEAPYPRPRGMVSSLPDSDHSDDE